jgi:stalled ribosome alternative rescue factor ArfA
MAKKKKFKKPVEGKYNPAHQALSTLPRRKHIEHPKKGAGSYNRRDRSRDTTIPSFLKAAA